MKVLDLKIIPLSPSRCKIVAVCEGEVDYNLSSKVVGKDYELVIKERKHKRTLTANAYYQVLLDRLAGVLTIPREELHRELLRRYGVTQVMNDRPVVFLMRSDINPAMVCKYYEVLKVKEKNGEMYTTYRALKGSSEMNSQEFAHLLDGLISECKEVGIETMTPDEIRRLEYD